MSLDSKITCRTVHIVLFTIASHHLALSDTISHSNDSSFPSITFLEEYVIGYTECSMVMVPTKYNVTQMTEKFYDVKECKPVETEIMHKKKIPDCKNVTKHHCVTKWEILESGEKVGKPGI